MSSIFSKPSGYALRALINLALNQDKGPRLTADIAEQEDIPAPYLGKVLGVLTQAGLAESMRGPNGGYQLAQDPENITLRIISNLFETQSSGRECLLGFNQCPGPKYCAIHRRWLEPQAHIDKFLDQTTLAELASEERERRTRRVKAGVIEKKAG